MTQPPDTVVRALTEDGSFRVIAALTTSTVKDTAQAQEVRGPTAQRLGELVTGAILVREAMAPGLRVQVILQGANKGGNLVADSHPDGSTRGIVNLGGKREVVIGPGSLLQVMRTMPRGIHQGVVEVPQRGGISEALMAYMQDSEQVASVISTCTQLREDGVARSGGYFVQLLPEAERGLLMVMTERLAAFPSLDTLLSSESLTPQNLLDELLYGMPFAITSDSPVRFGCHCSKERLLGTLATLPQAEIADMIRQNEPLQTRCDGCGKEYIVTIEELVTLSASAAGSGLFGGDGTRGEA